VTRFDVVVIGGGINGTATAFSLARRGAKVAVFEAACVGGGDTAASAAIVRMHYSNPSVVRMALRAREVFASWETLVGTPGVYTRSGWLFLVPPDDVPQSEHNIAMQRDQGVEVDEVDADFLASKFPSARADGIGRIYHEPGSGFADPVAACQGFALAARRDGALVAENTRVAALVSELGRTAGVQVDDGRVVRADAVVLAAGVGSIGLAAGAGIELPLVCTREQEMIVDDGANAGPDCAVSSMVDRFYARPRRAADGHRQVLIGRGFPKPYEQVEPDDYRRTLDPDFEVELRERVAGRSADLGAARRTAGYAALYDVTPDWHPLLGPSQADPGLWLAVGGSGHGFKLGPAIGEMVACAVGGEPVDYADIADFSVDRFGRDARFQSTYGGNRA
jgi:sarcosine oxidase subunit beta